MHRLRKIRKAVILSFWIVYLASINLGLYDVELSILSFRLTELKDPGVTAYATDISIYVLNQ